MKVSVETKGGLERRISVTVPATEVTSRYKEELSRAAKDIHLKGFRPGRVPQGEVERRFGRRLRREIAFDVARERWPDAAAQESLKPATAPRLELGDWQAGQDLHFHATFECMPEFDLIDFADLELVRPTAEVKGSDIDDMLAEMAEQQKTWQPQEQRASELGDQLTVDFSLVAKDTDGVINEQQSVRQPVEDYSKDPYAVPPKEGLVGVRAGETHEFDWQVPEDYPGKDIAGRELLVSYRVAEVLMPVVPKLEDPDFVEKMGIKDLDELRSAIEASLARNRDRHVEGLLREQALRKLSELYDFSLPEGMVLDQMRRVKAERQRFMQSFEQDLRMDGRIPGAKFQELLDDPQDRSSACEYVKSALLLRKVLDIHEISVSDDELEQEIRHRCQYEKDPQACYREMLESESALSSIEHELLQRAAMQYMVDRASMSDRESLLKDVMKLKVEDLAPRRHDPQEKDDAEIENNEQEHEDERHVS